MQTNFNPGDWFVTRWLETPFHAVHTCSISRVDFVFILLLYQILYRIRFATTLYPLSPRMSWCTAYYSLIIVGESASSSPFFFSVVIVSDWQLRRLPGLFPSCCKHALDPFSDARQTYAKCWMTDGPPIVVCAIVLNTRI